MLRNTDSPLELFHRGLPLNEGPYPTILYLAVGGKESLHEDPFSQPVDLFLDGKTRVLSVDIPFHGEGYDKMLGMNLWAMSLAAEEDFIGKFILQISNLLENLKAEGVIDPQKFAVMGLSRGGYLAALVASQVEWVQNILAFAPVTSLTKLEGFEQLSDSKVLQKWSLAHFTEQLAPKKIRFYIGNNDSRVDTDSCYSLIRHIVRKGRAANLRIINTELMIYPSIGHKGHGTPPNIFEEGVVWLKGFLEY